MVVPPMASIGHRPCSLNSAGHWTLMSEQVLPLPGRDHCYCYSLLPEWILCNLCFSCSQQNLELPRRLGKHLSIIRSGKWAQLCTHEGSSDLRREFRCSATTNKDTCPWQKGISRKNLVSRVGAPSQQLGWNLETTVPLCISLCKLKLILHHGGVRFPKPKSMSYRFCVGYNQSSTAARAQTLSISDWRFSCCLQH